VLSAQCNAHALRYAEKADTDAKEAWAARFVDLLMVCKALADEARERGMSAFAAFPERAAKAKADLLAVIEAGIAWHEAKPPFERPKPAAENRKGGRRPALHPDHTFAVRVRDRFAEFLRFMDDPSVPFTQN